MTQKRELDNLVTSANDIIISLLDILEDVYKYYHDSDTITKADEWLKWCNGEMTDDEIQTFKKQNNLN